MADTATTTNLNLQVLSPESRQYLMNLLCACVDQGGLALFETLLPPLRVLRGILNTVAGTDKSMEQSCFYFEGSKFQVASFAKEMSDNHVWMREKIKSNFRPILQEGLAPDVCKFFEVSSETVGPDEGTFRRTLEQSLKHTISGRGAHVYYGKFILKRSGSDYQFLGAFVELSEVARILNFSYSAMSTSQQERYISALSQLVTDKLNSNLMASAIENNIRGICCVEVEEINLPVPTTPTLTEV